MHSTTTLSCQKALFQLEDDVTYLNCAYMSPQMKAVEEAGIVALRKKGQPYRITGTDFFEPVHQLSQTFANLIDAEDANRIALIPSVSYGIANAAQNIALAPGNTIVVVEEQFPSNIYVWRTVARKHGAEVVEVKAPVASEKRGEHWNEQLLAAITPKTKVVALPHVHWADGTRFDLKAVREATEKIGAKMIVDGTQSVGALPFSVAEFRPDALICAGYKWLMGPYSLGLAYYGETFDQGIPIEENWINRFNSEDFAGLVQYENRYQPMARRYSVGEQSNFVLVPMLQTALDQLMAWGVNNIQSYCEAIGTDSLAKLQKLGFWVEEPTYRGHHLFGVRLPEHISMEAFRQALQAHHIHVSIRGNAVRISPHVYNEPHDFEELVVCCQAAV